MPPHWPVLNTAEVVAQVENVAALWEEVAVEGGAVTEGALVAREWASEKVETYSRISVLLR